MCARSIIAVVNDEVITRRDLDDRIKVVLSQLKQQGTPLPPSDVLEKQVLERVIYNQVQLQYAKETGLRVEDAILEKAVNRIAEDNKITVAAMRQALEKDGVNFNKFREELRDEIIMVRLREREVDNKIQIADSEIDNFLSTLQAHDGKVEEFNLSHILVRVPEQASPEQLQERRARAEQALAQIKGGADFRQVAASFSDAPDVVQAALVGWRCSLSCRQFLPKRKNLKSGSRHRVVQPQRLSRSRRTSARPGCAMIVSQTHAPYLLRPPNWCQKTTPKIVWSVERDSITQTGSPSRATVTEDAKPVAIWAGFRPGIRFQISKRRWMD